MNSRTTGEYPLVREIISLLGVGAVISTTLILPNFGKVYASYRQYQWKKRKIEADKQWHKFNDYQLKRNLERLHKQNLIEVVSRNNNDYIRLTSKGQTKFLEYKIKEKSVQAKHWNGKWYLVLYDISKLKHTQQEKFRRKLKEMRFLQFQKSVYLTPYDCFDEIEYLRHYFGLSREVTMMEISKLENEVLYKKYFGLRV